ncbi:MAG TPA: NAD(P)-dependent alcohol dehydrogenase [Labilithrix sp.]
MTMKAILIKKYGGPEVLEIAELPEPKPAPNEVIVKVAATSVNPVDWLVRDGGAKSFVKVTFPVILGCDLAGTVVEVGADVKRLAVGDEVFAMMPHDWGAHAERVALDASLVVKKPKNLTMVEAASIPVVAMTAWFGLQKGAPVAKGERVLVNGASTSVGLAAIQIAKAFGATVTAVCGAASFDLVKRLGADRTIDYKTTDFTTLDDRWDRVLDCVGTKDAASCARVLDGDLREYVTTKPGVGTFVRQFFNPLFGVKVHALLTTGHGEELERIRDLVDAGKLAPVIDKVYPFAEVEAAQEYSKTGRAKGKIVLSLE